MSKTAVKTALESDEDRVIGTIVLAFATDPPARWMFPDAHVYLSNFPLFARAFGGGAFQHESAYYVDDSAGAALWLPPGVKPDEEAVFAVVERAVEAKLLPEVGAILEALGRYHPTEPHWYLPMIGVDPAKQGRGCGSALLRDSLAQVDRDHLPAYLESTNPANIPLYERHGFELLGTVEIGSAPPMFPMTRGAR